MYTASVIKSNHQILVTGPSGFRNYVSCDAMPLFAVVQGNELHVTLESGYINVYDFKTSQRLRTITG